MERVPDDIPAEPVIDNFRDVLEAACLEQQACLKTLDRCLAAFSHARLQQDHVLACLIDWRKSAQAENFQSQPLRTAKELPSPTVLERSEESHVVDSFREEDCQNHEVVASAREGETSTRSLRHVKLDTMLNAISEDHRQAKAVASGLHFQNGVYNCLQHAAKRVVKSHIFEPIIGLLIFTNAIVIGLETEFSLQPGEGEAIPDSIEFAFFIFFLIELTIRLVAVGVASFRDAWFMFDFSLVSGNAIFMVISVSVESYAAKDTLRQILVWRTFRLVRFVRALRLLKVGAFKTAWRLVYGLITSGSTLFSTWLLLWMALYLFAILGIELITKDPQLSSNPHTADIVSNSFSSLPLTMLTLVQFVTLDSVASIYVPLIKEQPLQLGIYFTLVLFVVSISLMNAVTAVLVESAMQAGRNDRFLEHEREKEGLKQIVPQVMEAFQKMKTAHTGRIQLEDFKDLSMDVLPAELIDKMTIGNMAELFEMLDVDNSGELTQDEFVTGLLNVLLLDMPISDFQTLKLCRMIRSKMAALDQDIQIVKGMVAASSEDRCCTTTV
eukprot:TRINITY_DN13216_c0_g1_i2.p1 TRINITY_DN13216_c0_g1~~TRINITY_DN13216_c0_g1_i2.p1  ORF type:complete len:569 (-),score=77.44 TRINITY_DN13216_c0_g1_i2:13-1674(-)